MRTCINTIGFVAPRILGHENFRLQRLGSATVTTTPLLLPSASPTESDQVRGGIAFGVNLHNAAVLVECGRAGLAEGHWGVSAPDEPLSGVFAVQMDFRLVQGRTFAATDDCTTGLLSPVDRPDKPIKVVKVRTTNGAFVEAASAPAITVDTTYLHVGGRTRRPETMPPGFLDRVLSLHPHPLLVPASLAPTASVTDNSSVTVACSQRYQILEEHMREGGKGHLAMHMYPIYVADLLASVTTANPTTFSILYLKEVFDWKSSALEVSILKDVGSTAAIPPAMVSSGNGLLTTSGSQYAFLVHTVPNGEGDAVVPVLAAKGSITF